MTFGELYAATAARIAQRVRELSPAELARPVPACPAWDVHDLVAHVAGGGADQLTGRLDGFPAPAWSARHVAERRGWSGTDLAAALTEQTPALAALCDATADAPNNAWDAVVHEQDLAETFDASSRVLVPGWDLVLASGLRILAASRDVVLTPTEPLTDGPGPVGLTAGSVSATATAVDAYDLFRGVFSRRTVAEMIAWGWDAEVGPVVGSLAFFGPARPAPPEAGAPVTR